MPRRQLGQEPRRQHRSTGASDRLSHLPPGMAGTWVVAAAAAQLHDRNARGKLSLWRVGVRGHGALPDGSCARNEDRDAGGAAMSAIIQLRGYVSLASALRAGKTSPRA